MSNAELDQNPEKDNEEINDETEEELENDAQPEADDASDEMEVEDDDEYEDDDEDDEDEKYEDIEFNVDADEASAYKIVVTVQKPRVNKEVDLSYSDLNYNANIDGFRKGKVPKWLLENRYGKEIQEELVNRFKMLAFQYIEEKLQHKIISEPEITDETEKVKRNTEYSFSVSYETEPEFELQPLSDISMKRKKIEISDEKIAEMLENIRKQTPKIVDKDGAAAVDDQVLVNYKVIIDGDEIINKEQETWKVKDGVFTDVNLAEGEKGVVGLKKGEKSEFKISIPEKFVIPQFSGKSGTVKVEVLNVQTFEDRELDDEFAKEVGFVDGLEKFKEHLKKDMTNSFQNQQMQELLKDIMKEYVAKHDFKLPKKTAEKYQEDELNKRRYNILSKLLTDKEKKNKELKQEELMKMADDELASEKAKIAEETEFSLKADFINKKIAEQQRIFVTEEEFENLVYQMAYSYKSTPEQMMKYIDENRLEEKIRHDILTDKIGEYIYKHVKFEELDEVYEPPKHEHNHEHGEDCDCEDGEHDENCDCGEDCDCGHDHDEKPEEKVEKTEEKIEEKKADKKPAPKKNAKKTEKKAEKKPAKKTTNKAGKKDTKNKDKK